MAGVTDKGGGAIRCAPTGSGDRLGIPFGIVRLQQQIVDADAIVARKPHQQIVRQGLNARFDIAVFSLGNSDAIGNLPLREIMVLSQIFDAVFQTGSTTLTSKLSRSGCPQL